MNHSTVTDIGEPATKLHPQDCSRWDSCSANVCPITGPAGVHLSGEDVCSFLIEAAKGEQGIAPADPLSDRIMDAARRAWANKHLMAFALRKHLNRASKSPSKRSSSTLLHKAA